MKNKTLLIKAAKVAFAVAIAVTLLNSSYLSQPVMAEVIVNEKTGTVTVTGEDVPEYVREQVGEDISASRHELEEGWVQYCGYTANGDWFSYVYQIVDDKEVLAHHVWRYTGDYKKWYENGISIKNAKINPDEITDLSKVPAYVIEVAGEENQNREICRKEYEGGWVEYYGTTAEEETFSYMYVVKDGEEILADNVWRYDSDGQKYWYEKGVLTETKEYEGDINSGGYWVEENGKKYWYEDGVKQGLEGRGKEIYDPASDAWYWLDSDANGAMAVSKDVYQESYAGGFGDNADGTGKWVHYDENGHMVKGWYETTKGTYYFDIKTGAMAKGIVMIDGYACTFDVETGIFVSKEVSDAPNNGWYEKDGKKYWYEDGVRQGMFGRGKEIYDEESDAWYWLDSIQDGAMAVSKDVYQESYAGRFAENEDGTGKWVRYDENGHMVKGWNDVGADYFEGGDRYWFDEETGAMAKGWQELLIDIVGKRRGEGSGIMYKFDEVTGILDNCPEYDECPRNTGIYCDPNIKKKP